MGKKRNIAKAVKEDEKFFRKQQIIQAAELVLKKKGLNKLSIAAVAKEANLAQGTLYLYFKNKEEILAQITLQARNLLLSAFHKAAHSSADPLEQLRNIYWANFDFYIHHKIHYDLLSFYENSSGLQETDELLEASQNITALVISVLDRAKNQGVIKPGLNASQFAHIMWGTCIGIIQLIEVKPALLQSTLGIETKKFYEAFVNNALEGIKV